MQTFGVNPRSFAASMALVECAFSRAAPNAALGYSTGRCETSTLRQRAAGSASRRAVARFHSASSGYVGARRSRRPGATGRATGPRRPIGFVSDHTG